MISCIVTGISGFFVGLILSNHLNNRRLASLLLVLSKSYERSHAYNYETIDIVLSTLFKLERENKELKIATFKHKISDINLS